MPFVQRIAYKAPHTYFAGYLREILKDSSLKGFVSFSGDAVTLVLEEDTPEALERFSTAIARMLPYSLFMGPVDSHLQTEVPEMSDFTVEPAAVSLCPRCLQGLFDPASPDYQNQSMVCTHYGADLPHFEITPVDIPAAAQTLQEGSDVTIGERTFRTTYREGDTLFVTDASRLNDLLLLSPQELNILLSIEKPLLKTAIQDESLKTATGKNVIRVKLFDDAPTALLARALQQSGVPYLFMAPYPDLEVAVNQEQVMLLRTPRLETPMQPLDDHPVLNRFLNMADEFDILGVSSIAAHLPRTGALNFILRSAKVNKPVIAFERFKSRGFLERITQASSAKARLVENFREKFPDISKQLAMLEDTDDTPLFAIIAAILGLSGDYEAVHDASLGFVGNGGVKVDMKYAGGVFDYDALLASLMSFRLAGVATPLLAFSLFESLGDLVTDTLTQLKTRFKTSETLIFGGMLANAALFSRIKKNYGHQNPRISSRFALDD